MTTTTNEDVGLKNLSAEAAILGTLLTDPTALDLVATLINPNDFSSNRNGSIYYAICTASIENKTGLASIVEQLRSSNMLNNVSEVYLKNLTAEASDTKTLKDNVNILLELSRKREKIKAAEQIAVSVLNGSDDTFAFEKLLEVSSKDVNDGFFDLESVMVSVINGNYAKVVPTILRRKDGECLLYAGKLNWLSAPPEALKSFTALLASVQLLSDGKGVVYVDYEDDAITICERLYKVAVGQEIENPEEKILDWVSGPVGEDGNRDKSKALFYYISTGRAFDIKLTRMISKTIKNNNVQMVVLDGAATAISLADLNENDNGDVNKWLNAVSYPITSQGAAVIVIDHVTKNNISTSSFSTRAPRGAGSKLAAVSGTSLSFEVKEPASVYSEGRIEITVTKDRPGRIRVSKKSGKRVAAILISKPINDSREGLGLELLPAEEHAAIQAEKRFDLIAAEKVSEIVHESGPISKSNVKEILKERAEARNSSGFRSQTITDAFKFLVDNGYVKLEKANDGKTEMLTSLVTYLSDYGDTHADDAPSKVF
jgi:hypothetical protein